MNQSSLRIILILGILSACMLTNPSSQICAVELKIARQGMVKDVPTQAPYNGCLVVREGPGMEYPVKGHVVNGDTVTIGGTSGSWCKITAPLTGYVWASYLEITGSETVDSANLTRPLDLDTISDNSDSPYRDQNLPQRQKILEDNQIIELNIEEEITP